MLLVVTTMCFFSGMGVWLFGEYRDDFQTFNMAMQTLFTMMLGGFRERWDENTDMILFTIVYMLVMYLVVLSFLLAIVVEAYMKVDGAHVSASPSLHTAQHACMDCVTLPLLRVGICLGSV